MAKTKEDIERISQIIYRLEELGIPKETIKALWKWVRCEERKIKEGR